MTAYYNEIDPKAAEWLRQLVKMGAIAPGDVDERSIEDVTPDELAAYTQCHFFAGVAGWPLALRLAGWPDDRPVWTGSCPCQPFSSAGQGKGVADERHLWPAFFWLISQRRPQTVFGEQVSSSDALGWWDIVSSDLEGEDYACGVFDLCAPGIGAFHIRQRLYWVANSSSQRRQQDSRGSSGDEETDGGTGWQRGKPNADNQSSGDGQNSGVMADPKHHGHDRSTADAAQPSSDGSADGVSIGGCVGLCGASGMGDSSSEGLQVGICVRGTPPEAGRATEWQAAERTDAHIARPWSNPEWLYCRDGKARPTQPGIFPLVNGLSSGVGYSSHIGLQAANGQQSVCQQEAIQESKNTPEGRVMRLKGYGNAIVPQLAAEFILATLEVF